MQATLIIAADTERQQSLTEIERAAERAAVERIDAHAAAKRAATTPLEHLAADLAALEAEQADHAAHRARLVALAAAEQAAIDVTLAPLQAECYRLSQQHDFGQRAGSLRARRDALVQQRAQAERPLQDFDRRSGERAKSLREGITALRAELAEARAQAAFNARSDADLEKAAKSARFNLKRAHDEARIARATLDHLRAKLAEAHNTVDAETDAVHALAELVGEREKLQGAAFIAGKAVDPGTLADLDKRIAFEGKSLERLKQTAAGARAAIGTLEARITEQQHAIDDADARVTAAEGALHTALADLERRLTSNAEAEHAARMQEIRETLNSFRDVAPDTAAVDSL